MKNKLWIKLSKRMIRLAVPIIGIICLINYWRAELIVDKIHYGIFMLAILILMIDNTNGGGKNHMAAK